MNWHEFVDFAAAIARGLAELVAHSARRRLHHRRALDHRPCGHARQRSRLSRRRRAAGAAGHGRAHELHLRHGDDGDRLLHLPRDRARAAADQSRARSARDPSFIMYWGMVSFITPPVALATFAAAPIAGAARCGSASNRSGSAPRSISSRSASCSIRPCCSRAMPLTVTSQIVVRLCRHLVIAGGSFAGLRHRDRPDPPSMRRRAGPRAVDDRRRLFLAIPAPRLTGLPFSGNLASGSALAAAGLGLLSFASRERSGRTTP